ncbi:MAG: hypothetical protein H7239_14340 [Flavobacterium sp.]|nr:hypothetical protein [Flavobacterium sp.]
MFNNRKLLIATKHQKEQVIAQLFEQEFGVSCFVPDDFDTDLFGTFSGEINRKNDALTTIKNKCLRAMEEFNCDLAIASEGSFGPHPDIFLAHADDELLILIDKKNDLEIIVREISLDTNFDGKTINSNDELVEFAKKSGFPSHGLIIKKSENEKNTFYKGIQSWAELNAIASELFENNFNFYVETDMRAFYNPTRMKVIEKATHKLIEKVKSICPECKSPGFGIVEAISGLPCEWCKSPTKSTLSYRYKCQKCHFELEKKFPSNKETEDPMYCDYCNP